MVDDNTEVIAVRGGPINPGEARVNLTWAGNNYDLRDPVLFDIPEAELKGALSEIIRSGGDGIPADADVGPMADFVVARYEPTATRPEKLISVRPKAAFGT